MNRQQEITLVTVLIITALATGIYLDLKQTLKYGLPATILIIYAGNIALKNYSLPSKSQIQGPQKITAEQGIKKWAEQHNTQVEVWPDYLEFSTKELRDWNQEVRAMVGVADKQKKPHIFFVELKEKQEVVGKKSLDHPDIEAYPFRYCDHYQEYKRKTRSGHDPNMNWSRGGRQQRVQNQMGMGMYAPPPNSNQQQQQNQDSQDSEGEE